MNLAAVGALAARAGISLAFKVPARNAVIYSVIDMAISAAVTHLTEWGFKKCWRMNYTPKANGALVIPKAAIVERDIYASVAGLILSRIAGIFLGVQICRRLGYPVRPLAAFEITMFAFCAFYGIAAYRQQDFKLREWF
jgi:hypothetical protein